MGFLKEIHHISTCVRHLFNLADTGEISFHGTAGLGGKESHFGTRASLGFFELVNVKATHSKLRNRTDIESQTLSPWTSKCYGFLLSGFLL